MASGKRTRSAREVIVRDWLSCTFGRWRRSRPFWGGLLLILAGAELVLIPLASLLIHGGVKLVVYIGIGGVFGVLIGVLTITAGVLLWMSPAHKTFYAIAGVVLGILSWPASNLGGFFLGMLLAITGGSLAFAWSPDPAGRVRLGEALPAADTAAGQRAADTVAGQRASDIVAETTDRGGSRFLAGTAMPVVLVGSLLAGHAMTHPSPIPIPSPIPSPAPGSSRAAMIARADQGLAAPTAATVLTAGSATLDGLAYQGTAKVPVAGGGEQTMMVFTLSSLSLSGNVTTTVTQDGRSTVTAAASLDFSGRITLYATKLSGTLLGIPTTLTPGNVLTLLLRLLNTVTPAVPLTMTSVTTDQPLVIAGGLRAANLSVTT